MKLTFHVIFTTGTVRDLLPFTRSLLARSRCDLRLVANALDPEEEEALARFAAADRRLSFVRHPTKRMAEHGDVLNALFAEERGERFAFLDSDIFAVGDFEAELAPHLALDAVFSGVPVWATASDQVAPASARRMGGPQNTVSSGACLGTSYFAVYRVDAVREAAARFGIGFEKVKDAASLPPDALARLHRLDARCEGYETAKALNLLLHATGRALAVVELPSLRHVGGLSLLRKKERGGKAYLEDGEAPDNPDKPWLLRKRLTCRYLSDRLLAARGEGDAPPPPPIEDPEVFARVVATGDALARLPSG